MTAPDFRCERCDGEIPALNVTTFGDKEERWVPGFACNCPGPRCPCCNARLEDGRCPSTPVVDCPVGWHLVPVPDIA